MTKLFYPISPGMSFPFKVYTNIECVEYMPDDQTFPENSWFADNQLEWENRERHNQTLISPWVVKHLQSDPSSKLILYCGLEVIGDEGFLHRLETLSNIDQSQIHFISASDPQTEMIGKLAPCINTSSFHHWEMYIAAKTLRWDTDTVPQQKFLYLNRRNSWERLTLAYLILNNQNIKSNTTYSLHPAIYWMEQNRKQELEHFRSVITQIPEQYRTLISRWCMTNPWQTIHGHSRTDPYRYDILDLNSESLTKNHSVSIVTESHPYHSAWEFMPTEKTMRTIAASRPFVILGTQYFLQNLRDMGYQTFSDYWNEDYDAEPDLKKRITMIYDTVKYINTLSTETIHTITRKVCEHNRQTLIDRTTAKRVRQHLHPDLAAIVDFEQQVIPD